MTIDEDRNQANKRRLEDIANTLHKSGYEIGDFSSGRIIDVPKANALGKYTDMGVIRVQPISFLGFKTPFKVGLYLAELWIDNDARKAYPESHWVLEVYGTQQLKSAEKFAKELSQIYGLDVSTKISTEKIRLVNQEVYFPGLFPE